MYRTSQSIRILSAALAAVLGLGLVATAGGALREQRSFPKAESLRVVHLEPVTVRLHKQPHVAAACEQTPKAAL
jgi:predicted membrane-bound spermidine synthase